ncbi:MAG: AAA family ATPase, partial [Proteobacteria bacterium]|nr:AAA family ATPase [Pseudomonadota bacterium]
RDREPIVVWGDPLADGEVALLDATGRVVLRLSPFVQVIAPLPSAEPELFVLWRSGRGAARLVAAPWGFERDDAIAGERLASLTTEDSETAHDPQDDRSPYPGLAAYTVGDAERFVGREREVEALANRLIRAPMIAVLGPSGAGKSSFIHAGVLPRIGDAIFSRGARGARGAIDTPYRTLVMRPGRHPMHALLGLATNDHEAPPTLATLAHRLRALGDAARGGLVIVVDQLEELVTLCSDPEERARFADTLAAAADGPSSPVRVVATLRDDFAGVLESEAGFRGRFEIFVLGTPTPEALRRIVVEPARRAAVAVDPRVVDDMVAEVAGRVASLPLLSFTAAQLWAARDRTARLIGHDAYVALGGVAGALSTYADQIFDSLARQDQDVARSLFARLIATDGTRVPTPRRELDQLPGAPAVIDHLVDARLLVVREEDRIDVVEIVHECLAARWTRLARWRQEDAADRALVGDVRVAARRWEETGRRADLLWRGELLAELARLQARGAPLTTAERAFADASSAAHRRARRLRRGVVVGVIGVLASIAAVMAYLGVVASRNASEATTSARLAEDRLTQSLIAQGRRELNDGRTTPALAYFAEGLRRGADSRGLRLMIAIASRGWKDTRAVIRDAHVTTIVGDGERVITGHESGELRWWRADGTPDGTTPTDLGAVSFLTPGTDGSLVALGRNGVLVLDPRRTPVARFKPGSIPWEAARGPAVDELCEVFGYFDRARVAHLFGADGIERFTITPRNAPTGLVLSPTGDRLAFTSSKSIDLYDGAGKHLDLVPLDHEPMTTLVRADDLWTVSSDGIVRRFHEGTLIASLPLDSTTINEAVLAGDGVVTLGADDAVSFLRAGAEQLHLDERTACDHTSSYAPTGYAVGYTCGDRVQLYHGRARLGTVNVTPYEVSLAVHPTSGRTAIDDGTSIQIFDRDGTTSLARDVGHGGALAFVDATHVLVTTVGQPLWRWTLPDGTWDKLLDRTEAAALLATTHGALLGTDAGLVVVDDHGVGSWQVGRTIDVGGRVAALTASADGRWIAAQLASGGTVILDGTTFEVARTLEPGDAGGTAAQFDPSGELVIRASHGGLAVYDRATGDPLVFGFELIGEVMGGRMLADGRLEVDGFRPGVLDLPIDTRPAAEVSADIACRVPMKIAGSRAVAAPTICR